MLLWCCSGGASDGLDPRDRADSATAPARSTSLVRRNGRDAEQQNGRGACALRRRKKHAGGRQYASRYTTRTPDATGEQGRRGRVATAVRNTQQSESTPWLCDPAFYTQHIALHNLDERRRHPPAQVEISRGTFSVMLGGGPPQLQHSIVPPFRQMFFFVDKIKQSCQCLFSLTN